MEDEVADVGAGAGYYSMRLADLKRPELAKPAVFRYGWVKPLPEDYAGERHIAPGCNQRIALSNLPRTISHR
jgi:hypothetical protein